MKIKASALIIITLLIFTTGCSSSGRIIKEIDCGVFVKKDADGYFIDASEQFEYFRQSKEMTNPNLYMRAEPSVEIGFFEFAYSMKYKKFGWEFIEFCEEILKWGNILRIPNIQNETLVTYKNKISIDSVACSYEINNLGHIYIHNTKNLNIGIKGLISIPQNKGYIEEYKNNKFFAPYKKTIKKENLSYENIGITGINHEYSNSDGDIKNEIYYEFENENYKYLISISYDERTNKKYISKVIIENDNKAFSIGINSDNTELSMEPAQLKAFISDFGISDFDWDEYINEEIEEMLPYNENAEKIDIETIEKVKIYDTLHSVNNKIGKPEKVIINNDNIFAYYTREDGKKIKLKYEFSFYKKEKVLFVHEIIVI